MRILIVGGDRLGNIPERLRALGFKATEHVTGRKKREVGICISKRHAVVLVLTDYVNHQLVAALKREARRQKKRIIFAPRAWSEIAPALQRAMGAGR
ncbi:hypothetical protein EDD75_1668 [Thermodesulfitimonas autotrophica]|uniref:Dihydroorotate dehydrogenase n=1 Tax=Thermodesulfitimonas autotrophica TaxID=1894989 RepID=A0A3N5AD39_9THEO|nr:DUF2325 domain-containing protein [Thermodesulfitimonas autotrophica]RPF42567.1 hypothetical protein EDD75_1668 [Thermodesulfitimonas autotrophica]